MTEGALAQDAQHDREMRSARPARVTRAAGRPLPHPPIKPAMNRLPPGIRHCFALERRVVRATERWGMEPRPSVGRVGDVRESW